MKKVLCLLFVSVLFVGCGKVAKENERVFEYAEEIENEIISGDIDEITKKIFGVNKLEIDEELEDILKDDFEQNNSESGILEEIFKRDTIKVNKIDEQNIEYDIEAPNLLNIFIDIPEDKQIINEDDFYAYLMGYIKKAKTEKFIVSVPYSIVDEDIVVDYQNIEFINAITGNLLSAYQQYYDDMMSEYSKGLEN